MSSVEAFYALFMLLLSMGSWRGYSLSNSHQKYFSPGAPFPPSCPLSHERALRFGYFWNCSMIHYSVQLIMGFNVGCKFAPMNSISVLPKEERSSSKDILGL